MNTQTITNAPNSSVGTLTHQVIADLLDRTRHPVSAEVRRAVELRTPHVGDFSHARAVRQKMASLVCTYFWHHALPDVWRFIGAERDLGDGLVDLTFERDNNILIDEVKAGWDAELALARGAAQTDAYVRSARRIHGHRFVGLHVLPLGRPDRAQFKADAGQWASLASMARIRGGAS